MTRAGQTVQVTDQGKPLWILQAASPPAEEKQRATEIDEILDTVLREKPGKISAVALLKNPAGEVYADSSLFSDWLSMSPGQKKPLLTIAG